MTNASRPVELLPANSYGDLVAIVRSYVSPSFNEARIIRAYEARFASLIGGGKARAFGGGRVALAAILDALGIGEGDEVVVPGYTCVAVPNPILFRGAIPVYADIDSATLNIDPESVLARVTSRTRALVVQHTFGYPAAMGALREVAREKGLAVIEDCTHALGATVDRRAVGSFGDASFFSSEQTKVISTGFGGVAYSADETISQRIASFHDRCLRPQPARVRRLMAYLAYAVVARGSAIDRLMPHAAYYLARAGVVEGPVSTAEEMQCERPNGFETRLSAGQARVGIAQLERLAQNLGRRRRLAQIYFAAFDGTRIGTFRPASGAMPSFVRFPIKVNSKTRLADRLSRRNIQLGVWFTAPVHPAEVEQAKARYQAGSCPRAEEAVANVANLPCHPRMSDDDAWRVATAVLECADA